MATMTGDDVTVELIEAEYPGDLTSEVIRDTVNEKFTQAESYASQAFSDAQDFLTALQTLFGSSSMPSTDISYEFQETSLSSDIETQRPEEPSDASLTPDAVNSPQLTELSGITVASLTVPSDLIEDMGSEGEIVYSEASYTSALSDAIKTKLENLIENGGTGLGADVEAAILARAQSRTDAANERIYNETTDYFASRGWLMPPGAMAGRLQEALAEQVKADEQTSYEILIEQSRLAQNNSQHALTTGVGMEDVLRRHSNQIAQRALEKAIAASKVIVEVFNSKVNRYTASLRKSEIEAGVEKTRVDALVSVNSNRIDEYKANIERYKADVAQELGIVENIAKVYGYKIQGYEADAKVAAIELESQVAVFKAKLEQANNQTQLTVAEAELTLRSYLGALELDIETIKAGAAISTQLAASALSSVNASASMGTSVGWSKGYTTGHSTSISNTASLTESHTINE